MNKQLLVAFTAILFFSNSSFAQQYIDPDNGSNGSLRARHQPLTITAPDVPKTYSLFGERVPLEQWDVRERFDRELLYNSYMQGSTTYIIKHTGRYLADGVVDMTLAGY